MLYQLSYEPADRARVQKLTRFLMLGMHVTPPAVFLVNDPVAVLLLVLRCRIVSAFALLARQNDIISHRVSLLASGFVLGLALLPLREQSSSARVPVSYSITSVTTPAPTVRPPSRIANRSSFSIAIGAMISTSNSTLSPGITISVPSGNVAIPVTSVVRK